jgi:hypothetical protein
MYARKFASHTTPDYTPPSVPSDDREKAISELKKAKEDIALGFGQSQNEIRQLKKRLEVGIGICWIKSWFD